VSNTNYIKYLVELSQKGRKNSFLELCGFNLSNVYALCLRITASKTVAEKLTVKIFLSAWENIIHFREEISYPDWLKAIAVYSILEEIRSGNFKKYINATKNDDKPTSDYKLDNLVFNLPERERIIYVLNEIEGYSAQEISDFLGDISKEGVMDLIHGVRKKFVEELNK
jgi:RNA polymerase sigma-70 factor, ECF subfamily